MTTSGIRYHSRPQYSGLYAALLAFIPSSLLLVALSLGDDLVFQRLALEFVPETVSTAEDFQKTIVLAQIENVVDGINFGEQPEWVYQAAEAWQGWLSTSIILKAVSVISLCLIVGLYGFLKLGPNFRSRNAVEQIILLILASSSAIAILTTIGIVFSVVFESLRFFALVPFTEFLFGLTWNPQFEGAERAGSGQMGLATYGSIPLFVGTFLISIVALSVAVPVGLFSAIYLSEYASSRALSCKATAGDSRGVPTVVYGFFAALTVAPFIRSTGMSLGLDVASRVRASCRFGDGYHDHSLCLFTVR